MTYLAEKPSSVDNIECILKISNENEFAFCSLVSFAPLAQVCEPTSAPKGAATPICFGQRYVVASPSDFAEALGDKTPKDLSYGNRADTASWFLQSQQ